MGNLFVWTLPLSLSRVRVVFVSWRRAHRERAFALHCNLIRQEEFILRCHDPLFFLVFVFLPRLVSLMVSRPPASLLLPPKLKGLSLMSCLSLRRARLSFQTSLEALLLCPAFCSGGSFSSLDTAVCMCVWECASSVFGDVCLYQGNLNHKWN